MLVKGIFPIHRLLAHGLKIVLRVLFVVDIIVQLENEIRVFFIALKSRCKRKGLELLFGTGNVFQGHERLMQRQISSKLLKYMSILLLNYVGLI